MSECVFCEIVVGTAPAEIVGQTRDCLVITPLGPVTPGHVLIIPREHVADASTDREVTARAMADAASWADRSGMPFNLITSGGAAATQSIFHLHVHYVPRHTADQLMVPWGTLHGENPQDPHRCKGMVALEAEVARLRSAGDGAADVERLRGIERAAAAYIRSCLCNGGTEAPELVADIQEKWAALHDALGADR